MQAQSSSTTDPWEVVNHIPMQGTAAGPVSGAADPWAVVTHTPVKVAPNPYQQAAERIPGGTGTSMSAGPPAKPPEQPGFFQRFLAAAGIPTSQGETSTAVQNMLTPQPEPGAEGLLKFEESLPILGSDFRARADLARQDRPTSMIPFLGPAIARFTESTVGEHPSDTSTQLGSGANVVGQALGLKSLLTPKPPVPMVKLPDVPLPHSVEALTGLIDDRAGTVDPHVTASDALPHLRETAVRMGVDPSKLSGREAGQATLKVAEQSVRDVQNEFNTIRQPYNAVLVDQSPIAAAYRDAITPELRANEPKVARALEAQAKKFDQPASLEQVNQFRVRMNNQLNAFEKRGTTAQIMSDIESKASHAAANAARDVEYSTVGRLSGLDPEYVRALKQREGSLIETKSSLEREYNRASGAQGEAVSKTLREKVANTYPSPRGIKHAGLKELIGPKPIDMLNSRIKKMFSGLGGASELPQYKQVTPPTAPQQLQESGPSGPVSGGEDLAEEARRGGPGVTPPVAPDTSQTFIRGGKMGTPQGIADQVVAAKSGASKNATARVDAHKVAKTAIGGEVQAPTSSAASAGARPDIEITPHGIGMQPTYGGGAKVTFSMNFNGDPALLKDPIKLGKNLFPDMADRIEPHQTDVVRKSEMLNSMTSGHYGQYRVSVEFKTAADAVKAYAQISGTPSGSQLKLPEAPVVQGGKISPEHVAAENAFYTQARAELGANASPSAVLQRAQALKIEHAAKGAPPPVTPVPPTVRPTLTQRVQAQPTPTLRRVNPPVRPSAAGASELSPRQQATSIMLLVKQGKITPAEADSRIQRLVGPGGRRLIRRPVAPE